MPIKRGTAKRLGLRQPCPGAAVFIRRAAKRFPFGIPMSIRQSWPYFRKNPEKIPYDTW